MLYIDAKNVNDAWFQAQVMINIHGMERNSRNGPVLEVLTPVITTYEHPQHRVLFDEARDANPFFHLLEALWMLAGDNKLEPLAWMLPKIAQYSDDGETLSGAYGHRWRNHFGHDQLIEAERELRISESRRCVITMWDVKQDGNEVHSSYGRDLPCNTHIYFKVRDGRLHMTVCNRSNDIIWGLYGANAVHMSVLQEVLAGRLDLAMGPMTTLSDSFHVYTDVYRHYQRNADQPTTRMKNPYASIPHVDLVPIGRLEDEDIFMFHELMHPGHNGAHSNHIQSPWLQKVALPMLRAYQAWKLNDEPKVALHYATEIAAADWRHVCIEWINRRLRRRSNKET